MIEKNKFDKIMNDIVSSFYMENLRIPDRVLREIKNMYMVNERIIGRPLVRRREIVNYDFRRK